MLKDIIIDAVKIFEKLKINYALVGGCAGLAHGSSYLTYDVDFIVDRVTSDLIKKLISVGFKPSFNIEDMVKLEHGNFKREDGDVHLMRKKVSSIRTIIGKINSTSVRVCSAEDYIIMLATAWRVGDENRCIEMARMYRNKLDLDYLLEKAKRKNVLNRVQEILKSAEIQIERKQ